MSDLDGATSLPAEYAWPNTPGEFAALWNAADDEQRALMVTRLVENGEAAVRCFWLNHDGAVAELRHSTGEVTRLREALERLRALHRDNGLDDCGECQRAYPCRSMVILASVDAPAPDEDPRADVSPAPPAALPE